MKVNRPVSAALTVMLVAAIGLIIAVSGGSAKKTPPSVAGATVVGVRQTALGKTLVGANGRTLYVFRGDKPNRSTLSSAGLSVWPAFSAVGAPRAQSGASANLISTVGHGAGGRQLAYNGHPLYYFVGDRTAGEVSGQGLNEFGALWYVLSPNGNAVTTAPGPAPTQPPPSSVGSGY